MFSTEVVPEFDEPCPHIYRTLIYYMSLIWVTGPAVSGPVTVSFVTTPGSKCAKLGRQLTT